MAFDEGPKEDPIDAAVNSVLEEKSPARGSGGVGVL